METVELTRQGRSDGTLERIWMIGTGKNGYRIGTSSTSMDCQIGIESISDQNGSPKTTLLSSSSDRFHKLLATSLSLVDGLLLCGTFEKVPAIVTILIQHLSTFLE
jgi:hypothetical protein